MLSKRRIAVLKSLDSPTTYSQTIPALESHLQIYYSDPEGWQELASLYADLGQYTKSAAALEELMLLVPQNGFFVLRYAETLYTMAEYATAYKAFLRVLDMGGTLTAAEGGGASSRDGDRGPEVRALWGLKAVSNGGGGSTSSSQHIALAPQASLLTSPYALRSPHRPSRSCARTPRSRLHPQTQSK